MALGIKDMPGIVLMFGLAVVITAIMANILTDVNADQTADSYADNISTNGLEGLDEMGSQFDLLGMVIIFGIVIGVLIGAFMFIKT